MRAGRGARLRLSSCYCFPASLSEAVDQEWPWRCMLEPYPSIHPSILFHIPLSVVPSPHDLVSFSSFRSLGVQALNSVWASLKWSPMPPLSPTTIRKTQVISRPPRWEWKQNSERCTRNEMEASECTRYGLAFKDHVQTMVQLCPVPLTYQFVAAVFTTLQICSHLKLFRLFCKKLLFSFCNSKCVGGELKPFYFLGQTI